MSHRIYFHEKLSNHVGRYYTAIDSQARTIEAGYIVHVTPIRREKRAGVTLEITYGPIGIPGKITTDLEGDITSMKRDFGVSELEELTGREVSAHLFYKTLYGISKR